MQKQASCKQANTPLARSLVNNEFVRKEGLVEENFRSAAGKPYAIIHANPSLKLLWKEFMVELYKRGDFEKAGIIGRKLIAEAGKLGERQREEIIDLIDAQRYAYANSLPAKKSSIPPQAIIDRLIYEIPQLYESHHHAFFEQTAHQIDVALGLGKAEEAIALSQAAAHEAWNAGNLWLAYEFQLRKMRILMQESLRKDDLDGAIEAAKQALGLSYCIGRKTPDWLLENFFLYAYQKGKDPAAVRKKVLEKIPDFPSNHLKEIEELKEQIRRTIIVQKIDYYETNPQKCAELAQMAVEYSFLSPERIYEGVRQWIRETFEKFASTKEALLENYTLAEVRRILERYIPDIYKTSA